MRRSGGGPAGGCIPGSSGAGAWTTSWSGPAVGESLDSWIADFRDRVGMTYLNRIW